jgi:hypothetical protein
MVTRIPLLTTTAILIALTITGCASVNAGTPVAAGSLDTTTSPHHTRQAAPLTNYLPFYPDNPVSSGTPTTTRAPDDDEAIAEAALQQQLATDHPAVESLIDQWVPQLSSKTYGLVANGITYDYQQIWQDFESTSLAHPGALLLWSSDYSTFQLTGYYVTIMPTSYPSGAEAASWCTSNGLGPDDCYAKLISHTAGPKGATVIP